MQLARPWGAPTTAETPPSFATDPPGLTGSLSCGKIGTAVHNALARQRSTRVPKRRRGTKESYRLSAAGVRSIGFPLMAVLRPCIFGSCISRRARSNPFDRVFSLYH